MSNIRVLVVEDENIVAKDIQMSLEKMGYNVIGTASSGEKALEILKENQPSIILMDIMLKGKMSGIDTAEIVKNEYDLPIIFLTAYADESTLSKAKITEPYGYILKPFKEIDLHTSIEMALYKHKKTMELKKEVKVFSAILDERTSPDFIFIRAKSKLVKIKMADLFYVEALKDYVIFHTASEDFTLHSTMKDIETKLPASQFIRVHRSFIVRVDRIISLEQSQGILYLEGDETPISIGGSYKDDLLNRLNFV
ncbi:MAG: response regulator [Bacteroidetes bacterium]|nr:response regulator [Bacteroidota bacterium]